jgi:hypothetical protein
VSGLRWVSVGQHGCKSGVSASMVTAWPDLPEAIRAGIVAMVKSASK